MAAGAQPDYDALAQKFGSAQTADYDSLAQQHGGSVAEPSVESPIPPPAIGKPTAPKMEQSLAGSLMSGDVQGPPMPDRGGRSMAEDIGRHPKTAEAAGAVSLAGGLAGAGAIASPVVAPAARFAGKVMAKYPLSTYAGIEVAKRLPGIGPMLDKVPGLEWLPFIAGRGEAPSTSRIGRIGRAASGEEAAAATEPVRIGKTSAPSPRIGGRWSEEPPPTEPAPAASPVNIGKPSWTPPRAQSTWPPPGSPADLAETKDIAASVRDQSSRELGALRAKGNEEGYARNTRQGPTKGQLTGTATRPVKYTKTPGVKVSGTTPPAPGSDELLPLLEKSLELAKKAKGR